MIFLDCSWPLCSHACVSQQLFFCLLNDDVDIQFISEDTTVDHAYYKELEKLSIKSLTLCPVLRLRFRGELVAELVEHQAVTQKVLSSTLRVFK